MRGVSSQLLGQYNSLDCTPRRAVLSSRLPSPLQKWPRSESHTSPHRVSYGAQYAASGQKATPMAAGAPLSHTFGSQIIGQPGIGRNVEAVGLLAAVATEEETTAQIIDGKATAAAIREELKSKVDDLRNKFGKVPGLAVVLVGTRGDSETYVRSKKKACEEVGIQSFGHDLPEDVSQEELLKVVEAFNANPDVHGILVQLPLPKHIEEKKILDAISLEKDVDGFHPFNIGSLALRGRDPLFVSCTPKGCLELLDRAGVEISGKRAVVVGRSNIVGMPVAQLLTNRDATVTVLHSRSRDSAQICASADIVIAAVGKPEVVKADWIKPGAAVIDVGTNAVDDSSKKRGYRLVGDVDFAAVSKKAAFITPVPGGVGPMTIVMLLSNTVESATRAFSGQ